MTIARTITESRRVIPREWQISNPLPPYSPPVVPPDGESPFPFFEIYRDFIRQVLPQYDEQLSLDTLPSPTVLFMKEAFARPEPTGIYHELMLRQFLQTCQVALLKLSARPGLTQSALLHHELVMGAGLIQQRGLSVDMVNFCDMLLAEILDIYQSTFANVITQKYWSKTRGVEEVISHLLLKELELFRRLDGYSFSILASAMMRRALESAPAAAISALTKWGQDNQINFE